MKFRFIASCLFVFLYKLSITQNCGFTITVPQDLTICEESNVILNGNISGSYFGFQWTGTDGYSNNSDLSPTVIVSQTTTYMLEALSLPSANLIVNGDFSSGNTGFTTDYNYVVDLPGSQVEMWSEGTYSVVTNPNLVHSNFSACTDHGGGGNMMVVNGAASFQQVWCQTISVNPNQTYIFNAFATSVNPSSPAILQFSINGTLLGSPFSLSGIPCSWEEFYTTWDSGSSTSVEICITNQNTAPSGNDFAIDDIFFGELCKDVKEFTVTLDEFSLYPPYQPELDCNNPTAEINVIPLPIISGYQYEWSTGDGMISSNLTDQEITVTSSGTYVVTVTNQSGCTQTQDYEILGNFDMPDIEISGDLTLDCKQKTSVLTASSNGGMQIFNWLLPDQSTTYGSNLMVEIPGTYIVTTENTNGCIGSDTVIVALDIAQFKYQDDSSGLLTCSINEVGIFLNIETNIDSISWNGPDILNINATKDTISVGTAGTYFYELFIGEDCSVRDSIVINLLPISMNYDLSLPDTLTCTKTNTDIFLENVQGVGDIQWYQNGILLGANDTVSIKDAGMIIIELTDLNGCKKTDSLTIEVNTTLPEFTVTIDSIDCLDDYGQFFSQYLGDVTFFWEGEGLSSIDKNPAFKTSGNYSVTVTGQNGCTKSETFFLPSKKQYPIINASIEKITCDQPIGNITLNTDIPSIYSWNGGNGINGTSNIISTNIAGTYDIEAISTEGCISHKSFVLEIDTIHPVLSDIPDLLLTCNDTVIKPLVDASFYNQYFWSGPDVNQNSDLIPSISKPGNYSLRLKKENGCETLKSFEVLENKVKPVFTANAEDLNCLKPESQLNLSSIENLTYSLNQKIITNGFIIDTAGSYNINAVNEFGCVSSISLEVKGNFNLPKINLTPVLLNCKQAEFWVSDNIREPNLTYSWQTMNGLVFKDSILITQKEDIELIAQNSEGCESRVKLLIETDFITPNIIIDGNRIIGCNETYTNISVNSNPQEIYSWTGPGMSVSNTTEIRITDEGTFELIAENIINGCKSRELFDIIKQKGPDAIDLNIVQPRCFGEKGSLIVNEIFGGTTPYSISLEQIQLVKGQELEVLSGDYQLIVTDKNGCTAFDQISIDQIEDFGVDAGRDTTILLNESYQLNAISSIPWSQLDIITWTPSESLNCDHCPMPIASPDVDTKYTITIQNINGCIETDEVLIRVKFLKGFTAPNIFNPKSTNGNNVFTLYPFKSSIARLKYLQIYDRWGNLLFDVKDIPAGDPDYGWDGTFNGANLVPGVYVWVSEIEYLDQTTEIGRGDVTIIR